MNVGTIVAENVSRRFKVYPQRHVTLKEAIVRRRQLRPVEVWALQDVSFQIEPGESVGFMGRNGSGKTTLLRLIAGVFRPTSGRMAVAGRVGSLLELGAGFHHDFTGRDNIYLSASIYGLRKQDVDRRFDAIVEFSELERFIDLPVRTYSAGMYMRLGFSIAVNVDADVLLLDEVFAVGDEAFQRKSVNRILEFRREGKTIAFVSHSGPAVERMCDRALLLRQGVLEYDGDTREAIRRYHDMLADEEDPAERTAGLREWGSGEARVTDVRLENAAGEVREHFLPGEQVVLRLKVHNREAIDPPSLAIELRDVTGALLSRAERDLGELGWDRNGEDAEVRFDIKRLPLVEGLFQFNVSLTDGARARRYHSVEKAAEFTVVPQGEAHGFVLFEGDWSLEQNASVQAAPGSETAQSSGRG
ncbi:MAG TPA: ABC transporter ATP-binding protein [Gaiellaceae bacterium]|nr:ABC transporter ATP-binding protein [Gaiellaceae bacterium]